MDSTSLVSRFPQELIDKIIAENGFDMPTLCSCALVCHSFLPSSQTQIFFYIRLERTADSPRPQAKIQALHDILVGAPHLGSYVRKLVAKFSPVKEGDESHDPYYSCLVSVLQFFRAVTSFHLIGDCDADRQWRDLPREFRTAVAEFCRRSDLTTLWLWSLGTFTEFAEFLQLLRSPALRKLKLNGITLQAPETSWTDHIGLIELDLALYYNPTLKIVTNWLIGGGSLVELRRLRVYWTAETAASVRRIFNVSSSIENLDLYVPYSAFPTAGSFANMKRLRELKIHVGGEEFCHSLAELLEPCGKSLERLEVYPIFFVFSMIDWSPLANILTTEAFPFLDRVQVSLFNFGAPGWQETADKFHADFRTGLHHLDEQGKLEFQVLDYNRPIQS
ncbi:hypothetical protein DFH06DRAFT_1242476 [Mycena polygramma]|nr:hypothetical protein DFH06DRAFT_1242476 [Mycena polygramma]